MMTAEYFPMYRSASNCLLRGNKLAQPSPRTCYLYLFSLVLSGLYAAVWEAVRALFEASNT